MRDADARAAWIVGVTATILALPFVAGISMLDEGTLVHIADRLASGEVLYRDVATGVMPGVFYLEALLFAVFGRSLIVGRIAMILLFALTSTGVYLLARNVTSRSVAIAAALSFCALSVNYWRFFGYSPLAICLVIFTLAAARTFLDTRRRRWLLIAGFLIGSTILVKQNYGTFVALGVATGLLAAPVEWGRRFRDVATAAAVAAFPLACTFVLFAAAGAASDFWHFTVTVPLQLPSTVFARPLPPLWGEPDARLVRDIVYYLPFEELALEISGWLQTHMWFAMAVVRFTYYSPIPFLIVAGVVWGRRRAQWQRAVPTDTTDTSGLATGALYLGTSAFLLLGAFPRVDAHHLFMVLAPCFVLGAWALGPAPGVMARRSAVVVTGILLTLSLLSQIASIADLHPEQVRDHFLSHPRARVWVQRWLGEEIERHLREIETRVPEGEPIFVAPAAPMYYYLTGRPNPTRYPLILPGALDEDEVVHALDSEPVRYALLGNTAFENFPFQLVAPRVWEYVDRNFVAAEGAGWANAPFEPYLYERGSPEEPATLDRITLTREGSGNARKIVTVREASSKWIEEASLMEPPNSPTPEYQTAAFDDWTRGNSELVSWNSAYLTPSLVVRAPGSWRKVLVSWEVPADQGELLEFACALTPWAWAGWTEGQGAIVEIWVAPSSATAPARRAWMRWLNPRLRGEDRRWHRAVVDVASFVDTPKAVVTIVTGSAPTFLATDATVAWSGLRLLTPDVESTNQDSQTRATSARSVLVGEQASRRILDFTEEDLHVFQDAVSEYPELPEAHAALSEVAASLGRHDLALPASENAVRLDPTNPHYSMRLGQELQADGQLARAIEAMRVALELEPTDSNYHAALGAALLADPERQDEARETLSAAIRLDRANAWAWTLLSKLERRAGNDRLALQAAERSVELQPGVAWPNLILAESLRAVGLTNEAVKVLETTASLPMDASARATFARNLMACGRLARAREEALAATGQDPQSFAVWVVLAQVEFASERWDAAVAAWHKAIACDPKQASARVQLARALTKMGRREDGRQALLDARTIVGDSFTGLREVAIVLDEMDWREDAQAVWRRVLALAPEGAMKEEARRRVARSSGAVDVEGSVR